MRVYNIQNYQSQNSFYGAKILPTKAQWNDLKVFNHHIYEFEKGLRTLILTTEKESNQAVIESRLQKRNIAYLIQKVHSDKINVFFGKPESVEVIKSFNQPKLSQYTPEQDFILGTLLGYDKIQECQRYLKLCRAKEIYK